MAPPYTRGHAGDRRARVRHHPVRIPPKAAALAIATLALAGIPAAPALAASASPVALAIAPRDGGVLGDRSALDLDVSITAPSTASLAAGTLVVALEAAPVASVSTLVDQVEHTGSYLQGYRVATRSTEAVAAGTTSVIHVHLTADVVDSVIDGHAGARLAGVSYTAGSTQTLAYSAVTRIPKGFTGGVGLGTVVPLTAPAGTTGVVGAADLGRLTEPGGAWRRALDAAEADPKATVLLDPEVQASIRLAGSAAPGSATDLLDELADLPNEVIRLPYADGDVTLERAAGASSVLGPTSFAGGATTAATGSGGTRTGATTAPTPSPSATPAKPPSDADLLHWDYSPTTAAWPVPGTATTADLDFLARSGWSTALLGSADVTDSAARVAAGPHATVGSRSVLIADATASTLLATAASGPGVPQDAALAELVGVLGTDAVTGEASAVLAVPQRSGDAPSLAHVLRVLDGQPWIRGTTLESLSGGTPTAVRLKPGAVPADRIAPAAAALTADAHVRELGRAIVTGGAALTGPERLALLGVLSTSWRAPDLHWTAAAAGVTAELQRFVGQVAIDRASTINYVGGSGSLPIDVTNRLAEPVRVQVSATSSNGRLQIHGTPTVVVAAETTGKALVPVKSISNGDVVLTVTLRTPDGHAIGTPRTRLITINAGWETLGAVVLVVLLLALFGTGVYRNVRRARRRQLRKAA